jgi:hypothetical protein
MLCAEDMATAEGGAKLLSGLTTQFRSPPLAPFAAAQLLLFAFAHKMSGACAGRSYSRVSLV